MLKSGVFKRLFQSVDTLVTGRGRVDQELFDDFEESLLAADISVRTADKILEMGAEGPTELWPVVAAGEAEDEFNPDRVTVDCDGLHSFGVAQGLRQIRI